MPPDQDSKRSNRSRNPNLGSSIYQSEDGWHGRVTVGVQDDGRPDRRHVRGKTRNEVAEAVRRSHLSRNPVLLAKAPKSDPDEVEPYEVADVQRLLEVAAQRRNSARWALALALGLRQGEALGLTWDDVALDKSVIRIRRSRLRPRYAHGCGGDCGQTPGRCPERASARPPARLA